MLNIRFFISIVSPIIDFSSLSRTTLVKDQKINKNGNERTLPVD